MMDMFEESFRQKEVQLNNMNIQLNNTDQEKWIIRDQFCCQVWNFSHDHDFSQVFQHYPYIINSIKPHNCPYINEVKKKIVELLRLISTVENLNDNKKFENNDLKCKNNNLIVHANKDNTLAFITAKKFLGQFKQLSPVLTKNSIASKAMAANNNTIEHFIECNKKLKTKFSLKIQSNISLKFEQNRRLKEKEKKC
ncbi:hypothetical protein HZH68_011021 [Vespula germanica]|uniref:Uncharacterized protein n=1 Tax=Vespula germanica TaxID=30212 RepID=A0A834JMT1_VESGE|nr:hypothetical protein HZH68_011021 [Vespula germanica]